MGIDQPHRGLRFRLRHRWWFVLLLHSAWVGSAAADSGLFARENLVAWCIVPFDARHRGPEERAEMLHNLGFRRFAYDWRAEHLPTFEAEIEALERAGIELTAVWFPSDLNDEARYLLATLRKKEIRTQLWVTMGDIATGKSPESQADRVEEYAKRLRPIVDAAAQQHCSVALYNHGGWFGEPENQLAIIEQLQAPHVGMVYNLHHGHAHLPRLAALLPRMIPHLLAFNLNGMVPRGDQMGKKIWPLGQGGEDLAILHMLEQSSWRGPVGILGHTQHDAEDRLRDNLDGLDWLLPQLEGKPAGPRPRPRTLAVDAQLSASEPTPASITPVDPEFRAVLIDHSPDEAYLAVKVDDLGRIFVGSREKVFLFERAQQGFRRIELLHFPADSIIMGLEFRGNDLYVLAAHGLYLVPGGRVQTVGLVPQRILWGVPLDFHVSFHCLAWGPEGDLYISHGDPLLGQGRGHHGCWTLYAGPRAEPVSYTGAGAVLRVRADGTRPRVVAAGLRGPVGLTFDGNWNLFTNDNDHESQPHQFAPARLLHVTPAADFGWPNGWMARKSPERSDLLDCVHGALGRGVPCDLTMFDEPRAGARQSELLMCRWDRSAVTRYTLERRGASFSATEQVFAQGSLDARPTGIAVDRAGRVYVTSLYLAGNVVTPKCPSDLIMIVRVDPHANPWRELASGEATEDPAQPLEQVLVGASWESRRRAHQELLRQGGTRLADAVAALEKRPVDDRSASHLPWLVAALGGPRAEALLSRWVMSNELPPLRLHALRALAHFPELAVPAAAVADLLQNEAATPDDAALQLAALHWFYERSSLPPGDAAVRLAASDDSRLRQTAAMLLGRLAPLALIEEWMQSADAPRRLAGVLAAGIRLTSPLPHARPPKNVPLHAPTDTAFFSTKIRFADAAEPVALAELGPLGAYTTAEWWHAAQHASDEQRLFELLRLALCDWEDDTSTMADRVRLQSAHYLELLGDARTEAQVASIRFSVRAREFRHAEPISAPRAWVIGPLTGTPPGEHPIERGPIDLAALHAPGKPQENQGTADSQRSWHAVDLPRRLADAPENGTWFALLNVQSRARQRALLMPSEGLQLQLRHNGNLVRSEQGSYLLELQPGGNELLARISGGQVWGLAIQSSQGVSWELPERDDQHRFAQRLGTADRAVVPAEFLGVDWSALRSQGDEANGRRLFGTLGCAKCHSISADHPGAGAPSLADAGKRFSPHHIAESVLLPDRMIAPDFRATRLVTHSGLVLTGLVVRESANSVELLLSDASRRTIDAESIESRSLLTGSPMPSGLVKTVDELRDLIRYILSESPTPP